MRSEAPAWDATERPPNTMAPLPEYSKEAMKPTATVDEMHTALAQAEAACVRAKEAKDKAEKSLEATHQTLKRLEARIAHLDEMLEERNQEVQRTRCDVEAQTASTSIWHGKYKQQLVLRRAKDLELRALMDTQTGLFRFVWRILRNRALVIKAKHEAADAA